MNRRTFSPFSCSQKRFTLNGSSFLFFFFFYGFLPLLTSLSGGLSLLLAMLERQPSLLDTWGRLV